MYLVSSVAVLFMAALVSTLYYYSSVLTHRIWNCLPCSLFPLLYLYQQHIHTVHAVMFHFKFICNQPLFILLIFTLFFFFTFTFLSSLSWEVSYFISLYLFVIYIYISVISCPGVQYVFTWLSSTHLRLPHLNRGGWGWHRPRASSGEFEPRRSISPHRLVCCPATSVSPAVTPQPTLAYLGEPCLERGNELNWA